MATASEWIFSISGISTILSFIIAWILLSVLATGFSNAKKLGERLQAMCGAEYMEIESDRHAIHAQYNKQVRLFIAALTLMSLAGLCLMLTVLFTFIRIYWEETDETMKNIKRVVIGISAVVILGYIAAWISEGSTVWKKLNVMIKNQSAISPKVTKMLKQYTIAMSTMLLVCVVGVVVSIGFYFYTAYTAADTTDAKTAAETAAKSAIVVYAVCISIAVLIVVSKMLLASDVVSFTNKAFTPYNRVTEALNAQISSMLRKPETKVAMETYLRQNIHRIHPKLEVDPILNPDTNDPYKNKYYLYVEHRGGNETVQAIENTKRISLRTLKGLLGKYYTYNFPNATLTLAELEGIPAVAYKDLGSKQFADQVHATAIRQWIYDLFLGTQNQENVKFSKADYVKAARMFTPSLGNMDSFKNKVDGMTMGTDVNVSYFKDNAAGTSATGTGNAGSSTTGFSASNL